MTDQPPSGREGGEDDATTESVTNGGAENDSVGAGSSDEVNDDSAGQSPHSSEGQNFSQTSSGNGDWNQERQVKV